MTAAPIGGFRFVRRRDDEHWRSGMFLPGMSVFMLPLEKEFGWTAGRRTSWVTTIRAGVDRVWYVIVRLHPGIGAGRVPVAVVGGACSSASGSFSRAFTRSLPMFLS